MTRMRSAETEAFREMSQCIQRGFLKKSINWFIVITAQLDEIHSEYYKFNIADVYRQKSISPLQYK